MATATTFDLAWAREEMDVYNRLLVAVVATMASLLDCTLYDIRRPKKDLQDERMEKTTRLKMDRNLWPRTRELRPS